MAEIEFHLATINDAELIAEMNEKLIRDEGHRNAMSLPELTDRMRIWLRGEYEAIVIDDEQSSIGYALFRREPDYIYLRQFFVIPEQRRNGIGRMAIAWMRENVWADATRIRLEVLVGNSTGLAFWRAIGFSDYCITLEAEQRGVPTTNG
ncbi:MAG: GNAT family N-acetyltransferase [Planctomycetales bacterium]|nr:GNAT family N-acetyltransferase [Planctomycetales bacterium]